MTRQDVLDDYRVKDGRIVSPGKFEGEPIYAPYFYDDMLNGCWTERVAGGWYAHILPEDRKEFPELGRARNVYIIEDEQGFVYCRTRRR